MSELSKRLNASFFCQRFSLPENLVFYIAKNPPSPELYHKLIRCCKYFWIKNPIITLEDLCLDTDDNHWETYEINGFEEDQKFKIETLNKKLWICEDLSVGDEQNPFLASSLIPKIYRCDLNDLTLSYQRLTFGEFKKFISSGSLEELCFYETSVKNGDGTIVPIEKLTELLPKLQRFDYHNVHREDGFQSITSETAANLIAIPHFPKIKDFAMEKIPESFDFEAFFATPKVRTLFN